MDYKKDFDKWYSEYEDALWSREHEKGSNLTKILTAHTLEELHDLRKVYFVKNASKLRKKQLIEVLAKEIPLNFEKMISHFDLERYQILDKATKKGFVTVSETYGSYKADYFNQCGILYPTTVNGRKTLILPTELMNAYKDIDKSNLKKIIKRNTEIVDLFYGLLHYYGILGDEQVVAWLKHYFPDLTGLEAHVLTLEAFGYYRKCFLWERNYCHYMIDDPKQLIQDILVRNNIEYCEFSKEQLIKAGSDYYLEMNPYEQKYINYLISNYNMTKDDARAIILEITLDIKNRVHFNDTMKVLSELLEIPNIDVLNEHAQLVRELNNNTKTWMLKGHTPLEIDKEDVEGQKSAKVVDIQTKKKVGRNELCPCGSGKKHKKCCGVR